MIAGGHIASQSLTKGIAIPPDTVGDRDGLGMVLPGDRNRTKRQEWTPGLSSRKMEGAFY